MTWDWRADPRYKLVWDTERSFMTHTTRFHVRQRIPPFFGQGPTLLEQMIEFTAEFAQDFREKIPYLQRQAQEWVQDQSYEIEMWGSVDGSEKYMAGGGELIGGSLKPGDDAPLPLGE